MAVDYRLIGSRIKAARKHACKTQEQIAEELSVTIGYVSQIERGIAKPNLEMISEISRVTYCDIAYLIAGVATHAPFYLNDEISNRLESLSSDDKSMILEMIDVILRYKQH